MTDRALRNNIKVDGFFTTVTPPDEEGYCSYGVSGAYSIEAVHYSDYIIAAVNQQMPWTYSEGRLNQIHVSKIAAFVEIDEPIVSIKRIADSDPSSELIGKNIADLIEDGSTLQMGQGNVPNAILRFLKDKKDLGIHTEVFSDNLIPLIEAGVITGLKKNIDIGKIITTFIQGTAELYRYVHRNETIKMMPGHYTNNPAIIAQNDKVVAINAALQVDLMGQVCSESIGTTQYSGIGGQLDFLRGAAYSRGGKPIITLPSTAQKGTKSRIVAVHPQGMPITSTRNDVHWVVTEFGAVNLFGMSVVNRADALISIAHPDFKKQLAADFDVYLKSMRKGSIL